MESKLKAVKALKNIQEGLKAPKGQENNFGHYKYRSCEDIFKAVKPLLAKCDAVLFVSDELVNIGDRFYIKATATFRFEDAEIFTVGWAREELSKKGMDGSQVTGASSSYARKYALNGMFLIDDTKDSDETNDGKPEEPKKPEKSIFQKAKEALIGAESEARYDEAWGNVKARKKEFAEEDWAELEKIGAEEKSKHVSGTK